MPLYTTSDTLEEVLRAGMTRGNYARLPCVRTYLKRVKALSVARPASWPVGRASSTSPEIVSSIVPLVFLEGCRSSKRRLLFQTLEGRPPEDVVRPPSLAPTLAPPVSRMLAVFASVLALAATLAATRCVPECTWRVWGLLGRTWGLTSVGSSAIAARVAFDNTPWNEARVSSALKTR